MQNPISSNRLIAKNMLAMYFRLFLTVVIGIYTSRVI